MSIFKKICFVFCFVLLVDINLCVYAETVSFTSNELLLSTQEGFFNFFKKKKKRVKKHKEDKEFSEKTVEKEEPIEIAINNEDNQEISSQSDTHKSNSCNSKEEEPLFDPEVSSLVLCDNSVESYELLLELLKKANWSIEMSLCMTGGDIFQNIIYTTKQRMLEQKNLKVYVMLEPIFLDQKDKDLFDQMQQEFSDRFFVSLTDFAPTNLPYTNVYQRHTKFVVVDQKYFVLGGTNFEDLMCTPGDCIPEDIKAPRRYMLVNRPLAFRDQDIVVCSERIAKELRKEFYCSFKLWKYFSLTHVFLRDPNYFIDDNPFFEKEGNSSCVVENFHNHPDMVVVPDEALEIVFSGPQYEENQSPITNKYIELINKAEEEVLIANLYFVPPANLLDSLVNKAKSTVKLELIGNGANDKSPSLVEVYCWGNRYNYMILLFGRAFYLWEKSLAKSLAKSLDYNKNINFYEYYIEDTQLHKKVMIVDEKTFVIGSYNFCLKSNNIDQEVVLVINSSELAKKAKKIFEKDKSLSQKLSIEEILEWHFNLYYHSQGFIQSKYLPS